MILYAVTVLAAGTVYGWHITAIIPSVTAESNKIYALEPGGGIFLNS